MKSWPWGPRSRRAFSRGGERRGCFWVGPLSRWALSAPRGSPQIEVPSDIAANGILNVSALDKATGKQQAITITASSGLAKDDVEKMVKDAESHATEDKRRRQEVETRNQADDLVYKTQK